MLCGADCPAPPADGLLRCARCGAIQPGADATTSYGAPIGADARASHPREVLWREGELLAHRFVVRGLIGRGGMGSVYRVHDHWHDVDVAVKVPRMGAAASADGVLSEAEAWMLIGLHPNLVSCFHVQLFEGVPCIFTELVEGCDLATAARTGSLYDGDEAAVVRRLLELTIQTARGLAFAHRRGAVHQDINPRNVLLDRAWKPKLTDFGLTRFLAPVEGTEPGVSLAGLSLDFASPEQRAAFVGSRHGRASRLTASTDVWSWARTILAAWEGEHGDPRDPPAGVAAVLDACLQEDVRERPRDMDEALDLLHDALGVKRRATRPADPGPSLSSADTMNNLAVSWLELGRTDKGLHHLDAALSADPMHVSATYNRALLQWRTGRIDPISARRAVEFLDGSPRRAEWERDAALAWLALEAGESSLAADVIANLRRQATSGGGPVLPLARSFPWPTPAGRARTGAIPVLFSWGLTVLADGAGMAAYFVSAETGLARWDPDSGALVRFGVEAAELSGFRVARGGAVAVLRSRSGQIILRDLASGASRLICEAPEGGPYDGQLFDTDASARHLIVAKDGAIERWDVATCDVASKLRTPFEVEIECVALSADGRRVVAATQQGDVLCWEAGTGELLWSGVVGPREQFSDYPDFVRSVAVSEDGRRVVSITTLEVQFWDGDTGQCTVSSIQSGWLRAVSLSRDGSAAATFDHTGLIALWDPSGARCRVAWRDDQLYESSNIALDPSGRYLVVGGDAITRWRVTVGAPPAPWSRSTPWTATQLQDFRCAFEAERRRFTLAYRGTDPWQMLWAFNAARRAPGFAHSREILPYARAVTRFAYRRALRGVWPLSVVHLLGVRRVSMGADPDIAAYLCQDGLLGLLHLRSGRTATLGRLGNRTELLGLSLAEDESLICATRESVVVVEAARVQAAMKFLRDDRPDSAGADAATTFDPAPGLQGISAFARTANGAFAVVLHAVESEEGGARRSHERLSLLDRAGRVLTHTPFRSDASPVGLAISDGGGKVAIDDGTLHVWTPAENRISTLEGVLKVVGFSADGGRIFYLGGNARSLRWRSVEGGTPYVLPTPPDGHVGSGRMVGRTPEPAAASPDGRWLAVAAGEAIVLDWLSASQTPKRLLGHGKDVTDVACSPESDLLVSASEDDTLRVWYLDWDLGFTPPSDHHEAAATLVRRFVERHRPVDASGCRTSDDARWTSDDEDTLWDWFLAQGLAPLGRSALRRLLH